MAIIDLTKIDKKNFRATTVPLQIDSIKEYFENKELFFVVDYGKSLVKGNMFLTYLSNLDLPCEVDLSSASKQEKFDLIKTYMETRNLNMSDVLKLTTAELILTYKNVKTDGLFINSAFNSDDKIEFIKANLELFKKWDQFLYSTLVVYLIKIYNDLNNIIKVEGQFQEHVDPNFIGANVVQMFGIPAFTELYFSSAPVEKMLYFKPQFEEYMFKGKNLFHYFYCEENTMMHLFGAVLNDSIKIKDLINFVNTPES